MRDALKPTYLRRIASDEEMPLERTHLQRACLQPIYFYRHVCPLTLFRKGSCLQCNCSLISGNQSERPHLITILSSLSIIWGKDQSLTYSPRSVVNLLSEACSLIFWGCFLQSYDIDTLGVSDFLQASPVDLNTAVHTVWHQSKIRRCNDPFFLGSLICVTPNKSHINIKLKLSNWPPISLFLKT